MTEQVLISIVMPVYNCVNTVERAVASVLSQTIRNLELIIVNDGSQDGTTAILEKINAVDRRIKLTSLENNVGVGAARHLAMSNCSGKWITMLDADDWYLPQRLENLLHNAENLNADLVSDNLTLYDHELGRIVGKTALGARNKVTPLTGSILFELDHAFRRHHLGYTKPMVKKSFLEEKGITYDPRLRVGEDFLFLAEIVLSGARSFIIPSADYVYTHRISPSKRTISPTSRAGTGFSDILESCDYILEKYSSVMSQDEKAGLYKKKESVRDWLCYQDLLADIRRGDFRKAYSMLLNRPALAFIKFYTVRNRLQDLFMLHFSKLGARNRSQSSK